MRGAEPVGCAVYDAAGEHVGQVHDLVFRSVPVAGEDRPRLELTALVCGPIGVGYRLGCLRSAMAGPWPLPRVFRWLARHSVVVPWPDVTAFERPRIEVNRPKSELCRVSDRSRRSPVAR